MKTHEIFLKNIFMKDLETKSLQDFSMLQVL